MSLRAPWVGCLLVLCAGIATADERILEFRSEITIAADAGMQVTETIRVRAEGGMDVARVADVVLHRGEEFVESFGGIAAQTLTRRWIAVRDVGRRAGAQVDEIVGRERR
jgi:hypothetical protein